MFRDNENAFTNQTISTYKANNTAQLNSNNAFVNTLQPNNLDYKTILFKVPTQNSTIKIFDFLSDVAPTGVSVPAKVGLGIYNANPELAYTSFVAVESNSLEEARQKLIDAGINDSEAVINKYVDKATGKDVFVTPSYGYFADKGSSIPYKLGTLGGKLNVSFGVKDDDKFLSTKQYRKNILESYYAGDKTLQNYKEKYNIIDDLEVSSQEISDNYKKDVEVIKQLNSVNSATIPYSNLTVLPKASYKATVNSVTGSACRFAGGSNCSNLGLGSEIKIKEIEEDDDNSK